MAQCHDVAILGATPAGLVAAYRLAKLGRSVIVVDAPHEPVECTLSDFTGAGFFNDSCLPKGLATKAKAKPFRAVVYHNGPLDKTVSHIEKTRAGYLVNPEQLTKALRDAARTAGVKFRYSKTFPAINLEESQVALIGTAQTRARVLLIALGRPADVISELSLPMRTVPYGSLTAAALDVPIASDNPAVPVDGALHVVELSERTELGMFFVLGSTLHLRVVSTSTAAGTRASELSEMVTSLQQAELVPADLSLARAKGAVWRPPAGVALELETHVAKRVLLIGTAGGFAEAVTGQTLTASVRSACLAANAAHAAIDDEHCQDALMRFKNSWRDSLADFIRPPNTSLQMLLPLMFVNEQIVGRFTAALLEGENI